MLLLTLFLKQGSHQNKYSIFQNISSHTCRLGSVLGLGAALSAMCSDAKTDSRVHVTSQHEQLMLAVENWEQTDSNFQVNLNR